MATAVEMLGQAIATALSEIHAATGFLNEAIDRCEADGSSPDGRLYRGEEGER
ncbi:hypothetical protein [Saccharopolyspora flava]|uniref:hypothetical protein n=1 Tax=Saccharopolyspora flava TaxID=95161 RepID=UPI00158736E4|nr:hypothetical protein [Saccharopolyspora flava]